MHLVKKRGILAWNTKKGDALERIEPCLGERILLWSVRLASIPLFLFAVLLVATIYGTAILAREISAFVASFRAKRGISESEKEEQNLGWHEF